MACYPRRVPINPRMITLTREARGWNQTGLADRLGVTQGYVSKLESGDAEVSDEVLERLSKELGAPTALFSYDAPSTSIEVTCLHHRRRASTMSAPTRKRIEATAKLTRVSLEGLMDGVELVSAHPLLRSADETATPEEAARNTRTLLAVPDGPIDNVTNVVESAGVIVMHRPLGTASQDAVSTWPASGHPMMVVNTGLATDRQRFTIAHELGHLVMHDAPGEDQESQADQFASEFLAPAAQVRQDLAGLTTRDMPRLMALKAKWGVSIAALVRRAHDLGELSDADYRAYQIQLSRLGWRQNEPGTLTPEDPRLVDRLITQRMSLEGASEGQLASMALMNVETFRRVFHLEPPPSAQMKLVADAR